MSVEEIKNQLTNNLNTSASKLRSFQQYLINKYGDPVIYQNLESQDRIKYDELYTKYFKAKNECFNFCKGVYGI